MTIEALTTNRVVVDRTLLAARRHFTPLFAPIEPIEPIDAALHDVATAIDCRVKSQQATGPCRATRT